MTELFLGSQPIDALMTASGISNADLVKASTEQLTFKMVQKSRKGRRVSANVQMKVLHAFQRAFPEKPFVMQDLFNY
jgi:hypothetical protein